MNPIDDSLARLFRAAVPSHFEPVGAPPYGLETRVLAAWCHAGPVSFWSTGLLVRGLLLASIVMGLSFLPVLNQTSSPYSDYQQLADTSLQLDNTTP